MTKTFGKSQQYCEHCGAEVIRYPKPAETLQIEVCNGYDSWSLPLGTRYNKENGMRQFGIIVQCPNKKWYNKCAKYIDKDSLHCIGADLADVLDM